MGQILWLASYPKSGNTWVRAFLHNLFTNSQTPFDINKMSELTHGDSNAKWFNANDGVPVNELSPTEIANRRYAAHTRLSQTASDVVLVKTHNAMVEQGGEPMISGSLTGGAIYIIRNPLDVVCSYADHLGVEIDKMIDAMEQKTFHSPSTSTHVSEIYCDWSTHVKSWTYKKNPAVHVVRYEDMNLHPIATFLNITKFIGLKPPRERLRRAIKFSSFKVLRAQEKQKGFIEKTPVQKNFFRQGSTNGWKKILSDKQVSRIIDYHRDQMQKFDYLPKDL
tara:strand:- start:380 stop:1216 length:837 start_codon:yes stop_codon:yes gene_type:complete